MPRAATGKLSRELSELDDRDFSKRNRFYMVGSMGCAAGFGLGVAQARRERKVIVLDGDGALLMKLGSLATIGALCPRNFHHVVLDNGAHDSTGGQPTPRSGTAGIEAAISSSVPSDGRLLIIDDGAYGARMVQIAQAYGIAHDSESFGVGGYPDLDRIAARLAQQHYTQLAVVHHETSSGVLNPVEALGALCRSRGVELIVDAMSSYAGIPIEIEAMGLDFLVGSSNKCVQGMAGLAFVICKRERLERMQPIAGRSFYLAFAGHHRFFEQEGQMQFTPPAQIVYALEQALKEYFAEGGNQRHLRYVANWEVLDSGMRALGFRRLLPEAILSRILTCYLEPDHPRYAFGEMHDRLYGKGFTIYPGKGARQATFRLANMGNVRTDDMHAFLAAMTETIEEMGMSPLYSS